MNVLLHSYPFVLGILAGLTLLLPLGAMLWVLLTRRAKRDVSRRLAAQQHVAGLLGAVPVFVYRASPHPSRVLEIASEGVQHVLGYTAAQLGPGGLLRLSDLVHPDDRQLVSNGLLDAISQHHPYFLTYRVMHRDGSVRWISDRGAPAYDSLGDPSIVEGFAADVTREHRLAEERAAELERARETVAAREGFLTMAMHDIRSPLTALKLHVQANLRRLALDTNYAMPDVQRALGKIEGQVERMRMLVDDLLDVTRAASGRLEIRLQEMDLTTLVRDSVQRHVPELQQAGCEVSCIADAPIIGKWDWMRLEQVLSNLLSNAAKYGGGQPITVTVRSAGELARLEVRDQGVGLSNDDRERLFQRFERLSADHRAGSTGLGLWIVRTIVQALGGTVDCESDGPGQGTAFIVSLPLAGPPAKPVPLLPQSSNEDPEESLEMGA